MNQNAATPKIEELNVAWRPEAKLSIPSANAVFIFPPFGPGNYTDVVNQALSSGQKLPTGEQIAFMLNEVYDCEKPHFLNERMSFMRNFIMDHGRLYVPVINIWTSTNDAANPGRYAVFDENGRGLTRGYTYEELEDRLSGGTTEREVRFSEDRKVSFAPKNTYDRNCRLWKNGLFVGTYGAEGAEKLDRINSDFNDNCSSYSAAYPDYYYGGLVHTVSYLKTDLTIRKERSVLRGFVFDNINTGNPRCYLPSVSDSENKSPK